MHILNGYIFWMRIKRIFHSIVVFLFLTSLLSCSYERELIIQDTFSGIDAVINTANQNGGIVRLLIIHGMGDTQPGYSNELVKNLSEALNLEPTHKKMTSPEDCNDSGGKIIRNLGGEHFYYGCIQVTTFNSQLENEVLIAYEVTWAPVSKLLKKRFLGYDNLEKINQNRLLVNRWIKTDLLNDKLADPIIYLGDFKKQIQYPAEKAICWILTGRVSGDDREFESSCKLDWDKISQSGNDEIVVISFSLGSKIIFDSLDKLNPEYQINEINQRLKNLKFEIHEERSSPRPDSKLIITGLRKKRTLLKKEKKELESIKEKLKTDYSNDLKSDSFKAFSDRTNKVFMLANQLPLLGLSEFKLPESGEVLELQRYDADKEKPLNPSDPKLEEKGITLPYALDNLLKKSTMSVVAFSDPNDPLSYPLPKYFSDRYEHRFSNVTVSIAKIGYLGIFANPIKAHTDYHNNNKVINLIACGREDNC